jgi:hypothetical protein
VDLVLLAAASSMAYTNPPPAMSSNIPKFASFRPKPRESSEKREIREKPDRSDRRSEHEASEKNKSSSRYVAFTYDRDKDRQASYFIDRRGDPNIVTYGSLNRADIPAYRRSGRGSVLGVPTHKRIDREQSSDKAIYLTDPRTFRNERPLTSKRAIRETSRLLRIVKPAEEAKPQKEPGYIALSRQGTGKGDGELDVDKAEYRAFERQPHSGEVSDSDLEHISEDEEGVLNTETTQKNSRLIQRTRDYPTDLQAWLDLADHQEAMMLLGRSNTDLIGSDRRNLADIRITTYEQALKKAGNDDGCQIKLYVGIMTEAQKSWDTAKLTDKWSEVLAKLPYSPVLWIRYLDFVQSSFGVFKYETCCEVFHQCMKALRSGAMVTNPDIYLRIITRITSMTRAAGYQELALAIWQAILEFHLCSDKTIARTDNERDDTQLFEEFWESEVARIGEENAKGWCKSNVDGMPPAAAGVSWSSHQYRSRNIFDTFGVREIEHTQGLKFPGRTMDDIGEDDPFHLVMFSDIEQYLQVVPRDTPKLSIIDAFLSFCHLPPLPRVETSNQDWWLDPILRTDAIHPSTNASDQHGGSFAEWIDRFRTGPSNFKMTTEFLFDQAFLHHHEVIDKNFVRRALKLLAVELTGEDIIGEYLLAFEYNFFPTEAFKTAKQLLKVRPTSKALYNATGLIESCKGNSEKANQVFSAALSMDKGLAPLSNSDYLRLLNNWAWEALRQGSKAEALRRLISPKGSVSIASSDDTPDQAAFLRGRRVLVESKQRALLNNDYISAILSTSLVALLDYLSSDHDLNTAMLVFDTLFDYFLTRGLSHSAFAELSTQYVAHLLTYHATAAPIVKPSHIRAAIGPLISRFPSNTILLSVYAANEARFAIDDRLRGTMQRMLEISKHDSIAGWLFAVHHEMQRGEIAGSTSHSIRALFFKAEEDVGAYCPAIWQSHLFFELREADKERARRPPYKKREKDSAKNSKEETRLETAHTRVKETFFKGITHLPWCKNFLMLAFTELHPRRILSEEELRKVYNVMVEKELRIYVDIDTVEASSG